VDERRAADEPRTLTLQLEVQLDAQPVSGRLRTAWGAEERFVGWFEFVDALRRLHDLSRHR
jgi:hypothetical protein